MTAAQFLAFHRSVSCMVADDGEWAAFVSDSWGVPTDVPVASLTLPGTVEHRLQCSLAASRLLPAAAGGAGARSPPGSGVRSTRPSTVASGTRMRATSSGRALTSAGFAGLEL